MPAADFTPWVAECLAADDWDSIRELLRFIAYDNQATAIEKTFKPISYSQFVQGDAALLDELKAIAILCHRIPWTGDKDSQTRLLGRIMLHSIATHSFEIIDSAVEHLQRGANNVIRRWNNEMKKHGNSLIRETVKVSELQELKNFSPGQVGRMFLRYPVTFRACLGYSIDRGSPVSGTIRPQLQGEYGLRQYGLSDSENLSFLRDCGIFCVPNDLAALAGQLQKKELYDIASMAGVSIMKSWSKDRIIASLLDSDVARSMIADAAFKNIVVVQDGLTEEFARWTNDLRRLDNVALCLATV